VIAQSKNKIDISAYKVIASNKHNPKKKNIPINELLLSLRIAFWIAPTYYHYVFLLTLKKTWSNFGKKNNFIFFMTKEICQNDTKEKAINTHMLLQQ